MKSKILHILRNQEGYVSGQELCERFGVSRTAVWKAINQLKEEGYEIEAVQNKGYHIVACPDVISAEEVRSLLTTVWVGSEISYFSVIDSTNTRAKRMAEEGASHGTLVLADEQTGGRGRRGRSWKTPPKSAIAMSLIVRPDLLPEKASMMTLLMGMAVASACKEMVTKPVSIKWPNDVVIDGKKICGILTEMSAEMEEIHYLVIGTGINVNVKEFPEEIRETATSLALEEGHEINRAEVICKTMKYFEQYYDNFMEHGDLSGLMEQYNELLVNRDSHVRVLEPKNAYNGIARGINERGELLVEREDGTVVCVYAGEVSVRGVYGYV
jgi:BirA family biotin operon repressor/biotin-[acetyl-CoA-carboxylase] ligase